MSGIDKSFLPLFERLTSLLHPGEAIYLVGGSVRDALLGLPLHDLDFAVQGDARRLARKTGDMFAGKFFMLDDRHQTARVLLPREEGPDLGLDFAGLRADNLEGDLLGRDFTINAMALDLRRPDRLIDPLGGAADLKDRVLKVCSPTSLQDDPVRVLRAVRFSVAMRMRIEASLIKSLREAAPLLANISGERLRDEYFRIWNGPQVSSAMRLLESLGALQPTLPELTPMINSPQGAPHVYDVWNHTLAVVQALENLLNVLVGEYRIEATDLTLGKAVLALGRYRSQLEEHFSQQLTPGRPLRGLLMLAALYHDSGKPESYSRGEDGRVHFYRHDQVSQKLMRTRAQGLALSNAESNHLAKITAEHMRIHLLVKHEDGISRRAVYRYFRALGEAGVDVCLLSLADVLGTHAWQLPQEIWQAELDACRLLMEHYYEIPSTAVDPPRIFTGKMLMDRLGIAAGPRLGRLLDAIREAQGEGIIADEQDGWAFAQRWLADSAHQEENDGNYPSHPGL